jgi:hypothetical protein
MSTSSIVWERGSSVEGEGRETTDILWPIPLPSRELTSEMFEGWCLKS